MQLSILKYIFSLLLFIPVCLFAQDKDEAESEGDTLQLRNKFIPTGLRIGADLIAPIQTYRTERFNGWELNADVDFHRYYLAIDYGKWAIIQPLQNGQYSNDGNYYRFGVDVSFLKKDPDHNMFFLGFRVGRSYFDDKVSYNYTDPFYSTISKSLSNSNVVGKWGELTTGLRVKIWKSFWMGYTARMKFNPSVKGNGELTPFDIPGYGLSSRNLYWGFNYQIFFRIPWLKKNPPIVTKK